jgi:hypothetical protein
MRHALAALLMLSLPMSAETRQHGNIIYDVPSGWNVGAVRDDGTLILWSDLPDDECEFCRIYIGTSTQTGGRADNWVVTQSTRFTDPDEEEAPEVEQIAPPELFSLKGRPAARMGQMVDGDLQSLFSVQLFGRMELVGFEAPASDEAELSTAINVMLRDLVPLLEGARFVSEGAKPLMPTPQPGDLQGVWWGTTTWWSMGLDGMMKMEIDHHWLTFWPDGTFYDGTPPLGTAPFDQAERLASGDMDWGSYRQDGDRLILSYASGVVETLTADGARFTIGDRVMDPITPLADGTKINGVVSTLFVSGFTPGIGMSGGMTAMTDTTYHPDGSWTFGSYTGTSANFENGGGFATGAEGSDQGRYEVKDGLVVLYDQSGAVVARRYIFNAASTVWIGENMLE